MIEQLVPFNLGFNHFKHIESAQKHDTSLVLDGTYIYIQTRYYHKFQKMSYNLHKHRRLVKSMMIIGTNGYIWNVEGPYFSDSENNDAFTTKHAMKTNVHEIQNWLNKMICLLLIEVFEMYLTLDENGGFKLKCRVFCFVLFFKKE